MKVCYFKEFPKPYLIYPIVLKNNFKRSNASIENKNVKYIVDNFYVDPKNLVAYKKLCGFENGKSIPAVYFSMLSEILQNQMIENEKFSFSIKDLLHISHKMKQRDSLFANQRYTMTCQFSLLSQNQFVYKTLVQSDGKTVLESESIYIVGYKKQEISQLDIGNNAFDRVIPKKLIRQWYVPKNVGRKYAQISGVMHPAYLHSWSAKAFGYSEMTVHDMWLKARVLAGLDLPKSYEIYTQFKKPLSLPSSLQLFTLDKSTEVTEFCVKDEAKGTQHAVGKIIINA